MRVKDRIKNIGTYIGLGIVGGLSLINIAKAQSNTEYKKPLNEIVTEGDIIKIPENKLNEFIKNYKPEKTLQKTTLSEGLKGTITSNQTGEKLPGRKITLNLYDPNNGTFLGTAGPVWTNINGIYTLNNITDVEEEQTPNNQKIIQYIGNKIFTNNFDEKTLKIYNEIGQEVKNIKTNDPNIDINLEGLTSGRYLTIIELDKKTYANIITTVSGKITGYKKLEDKITEETKNTLKKITEIGATISITDSTNIHHSYINGPIGNWTGQRTFNMALPKVVFLPDSMKFTSPEVNYPINTEIRLWQYKGRIIDQNDYKSIGNELMPMKIYDPQTQPQWTQPIIDGTNNIRNQTTHNPDSLVQMTNEFKTIAYNNGFSQINIIYADSNLIGQEDHGLLVFYSSTNNTFVGAELYINTSTGMQPIDIYKAIQKDILGYMTQTTQPINNPKYLGTNNRGEPYNITTPEMHIIDIARTLQDIIKENGKQPIFINRFIHPQ